MRFHLQSAFTVLPPTAGNDTMTKPPQKIFRLLERLSLIKVLALSLKDDTPPNNTELGDSIADLLQAAERYTHALETEYDLQ